MATQKLVVQCNVCGTEFELPEDVIDGENSQLPHMRRQVYSED
jgi:alpha-aminoadipate carrier protein LysW